MLVDAEKKIKTIIGCSRPKIGVAVSGGSDSMCLLHFCHALYANSRIPIGHGNAIYYIPVTNRYFSLIAVNIDHSTREGESTKDSQFVAEFCQLQGINLSAHIVDAPKFAKDNKLNFEAAARMLRYEIFEKLIRNGVIDLVLTAHHAGDQAETVLLHALRGCGGNGLSGIRDNPEKKIYRPLITTSKSEIEEYLDFYKVPYITDKSNYDTTNDRNYLRHKILPLLEKKFSGCTERLGLLAENMAADEDYFNSVTKEKNKHDALTLNRSIFDKHDALIVRHILTAAGNIDLQRKHINAIIKLGKHGKEDDRLNLPNKMTAWKFAQGEVRFIKENEYKNSHKIKDRKLEIINEKLAKIDLFEAKKKQEFFIDNILWQYLYSDITHEQLSKYDGRYFNRSKLPVTAVLRTRKDGDVLYKFDGTKTKLKKYFIDKKIPQRLRDEIPLICDGNRVLFVAGYEVSKELAVRKGCKNIGELCFISSQHR